MRHFTPPRGNAQMAGLQCQYRDVLLRLAMTVVFYKEALNKLSSSLAFEAARNQGALLKACRGLPRKRNAECEPPQRPRRAEHEAAICGVTLLAKGYGHCRRSASCI